MQKLKVQTLALKDIGRLEKIRIGRAQAHRIDNAVSLENRHLQVRNLASSMDDIPFAGTKLLKGTEKMGIGRKEMYLPGPAVGQCCEAAKGRQSTPTIKENVQGTPMGDGTYIPWNQCESSASQSTRCRRA